MGFKDLRGWLNEVQKFGELAHIRGAHWDKEIGCISETLALREANDALLFDQIADYPPGFRVLTNVCMTHKRTALTMGIPQNLSSIEMVDAWRQRLKDVKPIPPVEVQSGPIQDNLMTGDDIDLFKFPAPVWHEKDKGRFLGVGCGVVTKDLDNGWVNVGTYRCQIFEKNQIGVGLQAGKHGTQMMEKYHKQGKPFPIAIVCGMDPALFLASCNPLTRWNESEYDFAGWIKGEAVEVLPGHTTGLPVPAGAEIVVEGEIPPPPQMTHHTDGPFGEWGRTYKSGNPPVMNVKSIMYRKDPIILGVLPQQMHIPEYFSIPVMAAEIWNVLEYAGISGVKGVWFGLGLCWPVFLVISLKQEYAGHAKQAAVTAASCRANTVGGLFVVVVDDDIDITNERDVLWAIGNRSNTDNFSIIKGIQTKAGTGSPKKGGEHLVNDRVIIDACWPYNLRDQFPVIHKFSDQYKEELMKRYKNFPK